MNHRITTTFIFMMLLLSVVYFVPVNAAEIKIFYPIADAYVSSRYPDENFGKKNYLLVANETIESAFAFIMFDLSDVPHDAYVESARLKLKMESLVRWEYYVPNSVGAYRSFDIAWMETEITWNTKPEFMAEAITSAYAHEAGQWSSWDVTEAVKAGEKLTIILKAWDADTRFYSRESEYKPELEITYLERGFITLVQVLIAICVVAVVVVGIIFVIIRRRKKHRAHMNYNPRISLK